MWKKYFSLAKPGIIMGNAITAAGGFLLAEQGSVQIALFLAVMVGICCVIGSACVFNNYLDRHHDKKMQRTKNRPLAKGSISVRAALIYATVLAAIGAALLIGFTNIVTVLIAAAGLLIYVFWYSYWKYRTSMATAIGSLAGAAPALVGYTAVTGRIDLGAVLLFAIMTLWQMPHFFAIAMYRIKDYAAAAIPVLPVKKGNRVTKIQMALYVVAFGVAALLPTFFGYTGYVYFALVVLLSGSWMVLSVKGFYAENDQVWARQMFVFSLITITLLFVALSLDGVKDKDPLPSMAFLAPAKSVAFSSIAP